MGLVAYTRVMAPARRGAGSGRVEAACVMGFASCRLDYASELADWLGSDQHGLWSRGPLADGLALAMESDDAEGARLFCALLADPQAWRHGTQISSYRGMGWSASGGVTASGPGPFARP